MIMFMPIKDRQQLRGRIHSLWDISRSSRATTLSDISNERACVDISGFYMKFDLKKKLI